MINVGVPDLSKKSYLRKTVILKELKSLWSHHLFLQSFISFIEKTYFKWQQNEVKDIKTTNLKKNTQFYEYLDMVWVLILNLMGTGCWVWIGYPNPEKYIWKVFVFVFD